MVNLLILLLLRNLILTHQQKKKKMKNEKSEISLAYTPMAVSQKKGFYDKVIKKFSSNKNF